MKSIILRTDLPEKKEDRKSILEEGLESGISSFVIRDEDSDFRSLGRFDTFQLDRIQTVSGPDFKITDSDRIVIDIACDWKIIPLENIIASAKGEVFATVHSVEEAKVFLDTLEKGVDGIIIDSQPSKYIKLIASSERLELAEATVTSVKQIGMGDRVCIDTCSMMSPGEGMLIGSYSNGLFLVESESNENGYVGSRPFRVNAGAVCSYILMPDGTTRYLSEIGTGDEISICDRGGTTMKSAVGRCKIESRPLLMVTAECDGKEYAVVLQNAETVRLVTGDSSIPVTELKQNDRVLVKVSAGGRHFGMPIDETVTER